MTRQMWGDSEGIAEGSDFDLYAYLTVEGATDTVRVTSSGTFTLTVSDSVLNGGTALLSDEASDSVNKATGRVLWRITDAQSSAWEAGTYFGDIKCVDSGSLVTYWPVGLKVREARD